MNQHEQEKAWRQTLKEGDGVVVLAGRFSKNEIGVVERTTATQIIVKVRGRERRFNKTYGREVGEAYGPRIDKITPEIRAKIKAADNRSEFSSLTYKLDRLADDEIAVMLGALYELRASREQVAP